MRLDPHDEERNASVGVQPALMKQSGEVRDPVTQAERVCSLQRLSIQWRLCASLARTSVGGEGVQKQQVRFLGYLLLIDLHPKACETSALN